MKNKHISVLLAILVILLFLATCFLTSGCGYQRKLQKLSHEKDSVVTSIRDSTSHVISEIKKTHDSETKQLKNTIAEFDYTPCPDVVIDSNCNKDSLVKIIRILEARVREQNSTIKVNADGSYELQGKIRSLNFINEFFSKENDVLWKRNDSLSKVKQENKTQVTETVKTKDVQTKVKFPWWLIAIGFVGGCFFWNFLGNGLKSVAGLIFGKSQTKSYNT